MSNVFKEVFFVKSTRAGLRTMKYRNLFGREYLSANNWIRIRDLQYAERLANPIPIIIMLENLCSYHPKNGEIWCERPSP